jgi:dihydrofolate reductase
MSTIGTFTQVSIDGYFAGPNGEIDWFKNIERDDEYDRYMHQSASSRNTLLMGRTTYEMMKSFWPTEAASKMDPDMASVMNESPKVVISKSLQDPGWKNVRVLREITRDAIEQLKLENAITILGSGSIIQQLTNLGLIDEYFLVHIPVVLGAGKSLFDNVEMKHLKLSESKSFGNGIVVTKYAPR